MVRNLLLVMVVAFLLLGVGATAAPAATDSALQPVTPGGERGPDMDPDG